MQHYQPLKEEVMKLQAIQFEKQSKLNQLQQKLAELKFAKLNNSHDTDTTQNTVELVPLDIGTEIERSFNYQPHRFDKVDPASA